MIIQLASLLAQLSILRALLDIVEPRDYEVSCQT